MPDNPESSFPPDVLKWIKQNATPPQSLKLMQICKYFKHQTFPYLVIKKLKWDGRISYKTLDSRWHNIDDINSLPNNLWIVTELFLKENNAFSTLFPKISYSLIKYLFLFNQNLSFNEYQMITNIRQIEILDFHKTVVKHENGNNVFLEDLFQYVPNAEDVSFFGLIPQINSLDYLNNVVPKTIRTLKIYPSGETFNIEMFTSFMMDHQNIYYVICYNDNLSREYIQRLQNERNMINKNWSSKSLLPVFSFRGLRE